MTSINIVENNVPNIVINNIEHNVHDMFENSVENKFKNIVDYINHTKLTIENKNIGVTNIIHSFKFKQNDIYEEIQKNYFKYDYEHIYESIYKNNKNYNDNDIVQQLILIDRLIIEFEKTINKIILMREYGYKNNFELNINCIDDNNYINEQFKNNIKTFVTAIIDLNLTKNEYENDATNLINRSINFIKIFFDINDIKKRIKLFSSTLIFLYSILTRIIKSLSYLKIDILYEMCLKTLKITINNNVNKYKSINNEFEQYLKMIINIFDQDLINYNLNDSKLGKYYNKIKTYKSNPERIQIDYVGKIIYDIELNNKNENMILCEVTYKNNGIQCFDELLFEKCYQLEKDLIFFNKYYDLTNNYHNEKEEQKIFFNNGFKYDNGENNNIHKGQIEAVILIIKPKKNVYDNILEIINNNKILFSLLNNFIEKKRFFVCDDD